MKDDDLQELAWDILGFFTLVVIGGVFYYVGKKLGVF